LRKVTSLVAAGLLCILGAKGETGPEGCRTLQRHGKLLGAKACFATLTRSSDSFRRAEGYFGLGQFESANQEFRAAVSVQPRSAEVKAEWGRLFLEHYQPSDAAKLYAEALESDPNFAPAYLGMARIFALRFDKRAVDLAQEALKRDPKLAEGHELLAYLALEDSRPKDAAEEAQLALSISDESLDALAVLASIDWLADKQQSSWADRILKINPAYGEAWATGGHFLEINYRYEDAIAFYRKAISLNPDLWSARSELGVNLMRLGKETEAREQLQRCYSAHYRNPQTVNSLRLLDKLDDFETFKTPATELVLSKKEAALLRPYVEPEMQRAIAVYQQKYKVKLPGPVRLEVYPNHDDFVVRTLGLPGQGGLLGVTFGQVVTMDSPSAGEFNWGSTLWHELSHVYVLTATHHQVPRWFTEGLAVHEEGVTAPDWGSRLTPDIIMALQKKLLLPVAGLDRGFVRPQFPDQVLVSYYEAGKICDYIVEKWGNDAVLGMIRSYGERKTTAEAISENFHQSPEEFDKAFGAWLDLQTSTAVHHFDEWRKGIESAHASLKAGRGDDAMRQAAAVKNLYPDYVGDGNAYEMIADGYEHKNQKSEAVRELQQYRDHGGTNVALLEKLARQEDQTGDSKQAAITLSKLNFIFPQDEESHRLLAKISLASGDVNTAVRESEAVLALKPADAAQTQYELAQALNAAHRVSEAKDHVILALEAAPDFKPAQQLFLKLSQ
jgi:cellulose synthase operon protein C